MKAHNVYPFEREVDRDKIKPGLLEREAVEQVKGTTKGVAQVVAQIDEGVYDMLGVSAKTREEVATGLMRLREQRGLATRGLRVKEEE